MLHHKLAEVLLPASNTSKSNHGLDSPGQYTEWRKAL